MTPAETNQVLALLSAGFPRQDWPESHKQLWREELGGETVGADEGVAAAREVVRGHEFLSFRAFFAELARVRERHLDVEGRNPNTEVRALESGERWLPKEESARRARELAAWLRARNARDKTALAPEAPTWPRLRADENYFYPPQPDPEPNLEPQPKETT